MLTSILLLCAAAPAQDSASLRPLEPMDLFELEGVERPTVSPDGSKVLFTRVGFDVMKDRKRSELWVHDVASGDSRPLVPGVGGAVWSPSGAHIAYVTSAGDDGAEIHVRWMDDGTTRQATRLPMSPGSLSWSPDGRRLAFSMSVKRESKPMAKGPSAPKGADWAPAFKVIERFKYRGDGAGYLENTDRHLFVVDAFGGTPRQLTDGPFDHGGPLIWTDERTILFSANRREDRRRHPNDTDLWTVDASTAALTKLTDREGPDGSPVFDRENGTLYWSGYDDRRQGHQQSEIHSSPIGGAAIRVLTGGVDRIISDLHVDGGRLYAALSSEGVKSLVELSADGAPSGTRYPLHGSGAGRPYSGGEFDVRGGTLAWVGGDPTWPGELHVQRGGDVRQVTDVNSDLRETIQLGRVEELWVESGADGQRVQCWTITPPDREAGERCPTILEIHGGPFLAYGPHFSFELQLMAAHGYAVVYGNPRGSTTYGEEFANAIHHAYPSNDYDDLMAFVDGAIERGLADPERLYVTGGSGGGVLTAWIVGRTDRFARAVVAKPVINWISFALTADAYDFFWQYWFPAAPWEEPEHYWKRSPLSLVGSVKTPTMLLTGEQDFRTPISESEQYFQALKLRGVETAMVRVPDAGHGIGRRPSHLLSKVAHILAWFER
ncbi:MAG: S9 family peptidase [Planctomycetota bacterium]|nr:S9 family peptidase [Planctomycetota bacterium]